ncbi:MAG: hypothetical protein ACLFRB_10245 [Thiohalorhabdus sp.]|uniref:hypothetical protein n=1 Tax=Thiohalorhabdus sp. TaxID=3094134 RepID=UPI003980AA95
MSIYRWIVAGALMGVAPTVVWAQQADRYGPVEGDQEVTLSGTGTSDTEFDNNRMGLSGSWGMYFQDRLKFSIRQQLNVVDLPGDNAWSGSTRAGADYHFDIGRWWPYVGGHFGFIYGDGVEETMIAGPDAGVKYYVHENTFAFFETEYQVLFNSADEAEALIDDGAWVHTVGVGLNF